MTLRTRRMPSCEMNGSVAAAPPAQPLVPMRGIPLTHHASCPVQLVAVSHRRRMPEGVGLRLGDGGRVMFKVCLKSQGCGSSYSINMLKNATKAFSSLSSSSSSSSRPFGVGRVNYGLVAERRVDFWPILILAPTALSLQVMLVMCS